MTKKLVVRIEKLVDDACWSAWYFWGANAHAHFLVWRNRQDSFAASACITKNAQTTFSFLCVVQVFEGEEVLFSCETLDAGKRACQQLVNSHIQRVFCEEYIPPLG